MLMFVSWAAATPIGRAAAGPGCGRRVAEVGARLALAGGWRMELEYDSGSVPSASPMSRAAASPIIGLTDAGGAGVRAGGRAESAGEEPS